MGREPPVRSDSLGFPAVDTAVVTGAGRGFGSEIARITSPFPRFGLRVLDLLRRAGERERQKRAEP